MLSRSALRRCAAAAGGGSASGAGQPRQVPLTAEERAGLAGDSEGARPQMTEAETMTGGGSNANFSWSERWNDVKEQFQFRQYQRNQRGGDRFGRRSYNVYQWLIDNAYFFVGFAILFTNYIYYAERGRREDAMSSIELNRRRFYNKSFAQEYTPYAPGRLTDGPIGYIQVDPITGMRTNCDGKVTAPDNDVLLQKLEATQISSDMVSEIRKLHQHQYSPEAQKSPRPLGEKQWTGLM